MYSPNVTNTDRQYDLFERGLCERDCEIFEECDCVIDALRETIDEIDREHKQRGLLPKVETQLKRNEPVEAKDIKTLLTLVRTLMKMLDDDA